MIPLCSFSVHLDFSDTVSDEGSTKAHVRERISTRTRHCCLSEVLQSVPIDTSRYYFGDAVLTVVPLLLQSAPALARKWVSKAPLLSLMILICGWQ